MSRIALLPTEVVDKIAAGEVVVRPVNAVKELIENSLDAGATEVTVSIRRGGLDLIKVQDNGCGIAADDMPIVCARFATSKLREYEDLSRMQTFGFRGEALASISYVANVTIISRQNSDVCAHKATYQDGKITGTLSRSAGLKGTVIIAENLFYNCPARHRAMKYPQEEATRILDLLVKYAIENPSVAFALRRLDGPSSDFRTSGTGDRQATIRALLGLRELMDTNYTDDEDLHFSFRATFSVPVALRTSTAVQSRQDRYKSFHLFINGRNVDSPRMKQSIDLVFTAKGSTYQFINISLQIDPSRVDVNVHPTKAIVHFLNEDQIIQAVESHMSKLVNDYCSTGIVEMPVTSKASISSSGDFAVKASLSTSCQNLSMASIQRNADASPGNHNASIKKPRISDFEAPSRAGLAPRNAMEENEKNNKILRNDNAKVSLSSAISSNFVQRVRIDANNRRLDEFLTPATTSSSDRDNAGDSVKIVSNTQLVPLSSRIINNLKETNADTTVLLNNSQNVSRTFQLDSLDRLRREICREVDESLTNIFRKHYFVGLYGNGGYGVFQVDEAAYLVKLDVIVREFFYQLVIFSFGNMGSYRLHVGSNVVNDSENMSENLRLRDLLELYFELNDLTPEADEVDDLLQRISAISDLLWDYFSIGIDKLSSLATKKSVIGQESCNIIAKDELILRSVPCIIDGYIPPLEYLPMLIFELGNVDCSEEDKCFKDIATVLSNFFTPQMVYMQADEDEDTADADLLKSSLCRFVLPTLKSKFLPPARLSIYMQKITSIEVAFKKFGRC